MSKKTTSKAPKKGDLQGSAIGDFILSLLKKFRPDLSKLDLAAHRMHLASLAKLWAETTDLPGDWDDTIWAFGADAFSDMLENALKSAPDSDEDGGVVLFGMPKGGADAVEVEMRDYTKQDVTDYLYVLGTSVPAECRKKIEKNPKLLAMLKRLSRENQIRVVNSSELLDFLLKWGPVILSILLKFLPFIL